MFNFLNKKTVLSLLAIAIILMIPMVSLASHAGCETLITTPLPCFADGIESAIIDTFAAAISKITAMLVSFAAAFVQLMIHLSVKIIDSPIVKEGFRTALNLTNLGFVLAIIFIAFLTIFRLQGYETKKLLKNLIIAAVLVNFSFTIAGSVMDVGNVFSLFFIKASIGGDSKNIENYTNSLAQLFKTQELVTAAPPATAGEDEGVIKSVISGAWSLLSSTGDAVLQAVPAGSTVLSAKGWVLEKLGIEDKTKGLATSYEGMLRMIAAFAMIIIFNSVLVITFFAIAFMMLIRYITLSILLILMPFAWLCWIFPSLSNHWKKWWNEFIKWNIFLPVSMFFIYFTLLTADRLNAAISVGVGQGGLAALVAAAGFTWLPVNSLLAILQGIVQVALIFGGLIVAQKIGIHGASAALNMAGSVKSWVTGAAVAATGIPLAGRMAKQTGARAGGNLAMEAGKIIAKRTPFQAIGAKLMSYGEAPKAARKKSIEERAKVITKEHDNKENFLALLRSTAYTNDEMASRALAWSQKSNSKEIEEQIGTETVDRFLKAAGDAGVGKAIGENRIDLAGRMEKGKKGKDGKEMTAAEIVAEKTADWGTEEWKKQKPEAYNSPDVMAAITPAMLGDILKGKGGASPKKLDAIIQGISELNEKDPAQLEKIDYTKGNPALRKMLREHTKKIMEELEKKSGKGTPEHKKMQELSKRFNLSAKEEAKADREEEEDEEEETKDGKEGTEEAGESKDKGGDKKTG